MKYESPKFVNEKLETADAVATSTVAVAYVNKTITENGVEKSVTATQVTVDVSGLF